ncbi:hypothetical protein M0813_24367 [Anaeramoeba flamelloides]|uniref:Uncharacterized protein n=1 Tax=Anaeramoeba flamelloides TaxID=1746091 RepID=A0ABQ8Y6C1_9EUKA|nr:hypothetical protein M0813_24367 [Anaeramoeba flamelloides]
MGNRYKLYNKNYGEEYDPIDDDDIDCEIENEFYGVIMVKGGWIVVNNIIVKLGAIFRSNEKMFIIIAFYDSNKLEKMCIIQEIFIVSVTDQDLINYIKLIKPDQRKKIKMEKILKDYEYLNVVETLDTIDNNNLGGIYHFILAKQDKYEEKEKEFYFVINEAINIKPNQNHLILPLIIYSDDFSFNASMEQQPDTSIDGIYITFASQVRKIRKLKSSHYPITFIPKSKDFWTTLTPIVDDLLILEKGVSINDENNQNLIIFSPILLWITDLIEKAKILGTKCSTGKTINSCLNCDSGFKHWITNKKPTCFKNTNYFKEAQQMLMNANLSKKEIKELETKRD